MKSLSQNREREPQRDGRATTAGPLAPNCTDAPDVAALASISSDRPVLLVCLRHLGCAFAREALADLRAQRAAIEAAGTRLVLAHLEPPSIAERWLRRYGMGDVAAISDPSASVYESCGLERGRVGQLVGPGVLWRWVRAALLGRHGAGWTGADLRRMPGLFLIDRGRIVRAFRHRTSADRPDYAAFCSSSRRGGEPER